MNTIREENIYTGVKVNLSGLVLEDFLFGCLSSYTGDNNGSIFSDVRTMNSAYVWNTAAPATTWYENDVTGGAYSHVIEGASYKIHTTISGWNPF